MLFGILVKKPLFDPWVTLANPTLVRVAPFLAFGGWRLVAVGGSWRLVAVGGWGLVVLGGGL